jgi:hypothetical protein
MKKPGSREKKPGFSALGGTRTPNLLIRSQMLYPLSYKRVGVALRCLGNFRSLLGLADLVNPRLAKGLVGSSVAESEGFEPSREI